MTTDITAPLNRFYVLQHHRNYHCIIIIIVINMAQILIDVAKYFDEI